MVDFDSRTSSRKEDVTVHRRSKLSMLNTTERSWEYTQDMSIICRPTHTVRMDRTDVPMDPRERERDGWKVIEKSCENK